MSSFFGLEVASRALRTQQVALDVTAHNVANANTPGYSRQTVAMVATPPYTVAGYSRPLGPGQVGTGVTVGGIERVRDPFLDLRLRGELSTQAFSQGLEQQLQQVEDVVSDPSSGGFSSLIDGFFNAWQDLANDPSSDPARQILVSRSTDLANQFNRVSSELTQFQSQLDDQVGLQVVEVNRLASQVSDLSLRISQIEFDGQHANDLRDQRDVALDQLAQLAKITVNENSNGTVDVLLGSRALVQGFTTDPLTTTPTGPNGFLEVRFASDNALASVTEGSIGGLIEVRDQRIGATRASLDQLAASLISATNGLHTTGYGEDGLNGRPFFAGTDAATIGVDPAMVADPGRIGVASAAGQAGNNAIALSIAQLRHSMSPTLESGYATLVASVASQISSARNLNETQTSVIGFLSSRREEVSGVSLDEEGVNMLRYQRAYEAAARVITAVDEMLDKLINQTGVVGR